MAYTTPPTFTAFNTLTAAQMTILGNNDLSFRDGTGLGDNTITSEKLKSTVAFRARRTTSQALGDLSAAKIQFATETYDLGADFDNATNYRFVAPVAGVYHFACGANYQASATRGALLIYVNGVVAETFEDVAATVVRAVSGATDLSLAANDYVEVYGFRGGAGNISEAFFTGHLVGRT